LKDGEEMRRRLHERLRAARAQHGLSLTTIAREHGVREQSLLLVESDAFEELPTGLYGRHAVRAYALAVGIPADEALAEVAERLRQPEDPLDGLARVRGIERHRERKPAAAARDVERPAVAWPSWRPPVAALIDAGILFAIDASVLGLTALAAGAGVAETLRIAAPAMALLFAVIGAVYFLLLGGIRKATIGARIAQAPVCVDMLGVDAHAVVQRGLQCLVAEGTSLASLVAVTEPARHLARTLRERRA
jgi:transcriptional regulator with XRE-family HTH domain